MCLKFLHVSVGMNYSLFCFSFPIGLNYKKLTDENMNPLEALEPVLSSQNILSISKLVPKIPDKDGRMLSPSSLYAVWLQKLFWTGDPHLARPAPEPPSAWLRACEVCVKYFDRLHPADLVTVVDAMTFSPKAVTQVTKKRVYSRLTVLEEMKTALTFRRFCFFPFLKWGILTREAFFLFLLSVRCSNWDIIFLCHRSARRLNQTQLFKFTRTFRTRYSSHNISF